MWRLSEEFGWTPDDKLADSRFVAPAALARMRASPGPARRTEWFYLPNGIFFRATVVFPDRAATSARKARELLEFTQDAIARIDALCTPGVARPRTLDLTLYLWDGAKRLPARAGAEIGPDHINTGVTSWNYGGSCSVLVYRREDLEKTIVHELLHCYGIGDWCNRDATVLAHCRAKAADFGHDAKLLPGETVVDALAIYITAGMKSVPFDCCVDLACAVFARIADHFGGRKWRESSNVFCYVALKVPVLADAQDLFVFPVDDPNRTLIRRAFAKPIPHALELAPAAGARRGPRSRSLKMFP